MQRALSAGTRSPCLRGCCAQPIGKTAARKENRLHRCYTAQLTDITLEGDWELRPWTDGQLLLGMTEGWLLTEERVQPMAIHGRVFTERAGGVLVTQSITAERTEVCTWMPDGQPIDAVTVPNDVPVSPGQSESSRLFYAPDLSNCDEEYLRSL